MRRGNLGCAGTLLNPQGPDQFLPTTPTVSPGEIKSRLERVVAWAELEEFIDAPMRTYSTGMMARLAFSVATDVDPDILLVDLLVDEALAVGDERFQLKCLERMENFRRASKTVLFVSHALAQVRDKGR